MNALAAQLVAADFTNRPHRRYQNWLVIWLAQFVELIDLVDVIRYALLLF